MTSNASMLTAARGGVVLYNDREHGVIMRVTWWVHLTVIVLATSVGVAAPAKPKPAGDAGMAAIEQALRTGQYERARKSADQLSRRKGAGARAAILAARAEQELGLLMEARRRLEEATITAPDDLPLRAELVRVVDALGDRGATKDLVNRSYDDWSGGRVDRKDAAALVAMATIVRADNNWEDANRTFRDAIRLLGTDRRAVEANLEWGAMFLEKHAADNAIACFRDALRLDPQHPEVRAALARALLEQGYDGAAAEREITAALSVNPRQADALALRAEIALDAEEMDHVVNLVAELRKTNPRDPAAAWLSASRALLLEDNKTYERERDRRMETRAADGEFFARTAEALVRHRRYDDARAVAQEGVARDGTHARLLASLGNTLLRLGDEDEGLANLRKAWERDPYDVRTYNLLTLFEKVIPAQYVTLQTKNFRFRIEPGARTVMEEVVAPFLEETHARYVKRYGFTPRGPIVIELYGAPEHYAIRTVGLPRLGVAGVCFGRVITSQAPRNGAFNWGMVLAHELAHVFALELSRSRVPRWITEGLSERETAHLRPEWARQADLDLHAASRAGALPPLVSLSQAFVRARNSEAASLAYMHAAAAVEFLERRFGFPKLREALAAFGRGEKGAPVLEALAGMPIEALEREFRQDLDARLAGFADQFLPEHLSRHAPPRPEPRGSAAASAAALAQVGLAALAAGDPEGAQAAWERARSRPKAAAEALVQFLGAALALRTGRADEARQTLQALKAAGLRGYDLEVSLGLAALRMKDTAAAEAHLREAAALAPKSVEARALLAEHLKSLGKVEEQLAVETEIIRLEPQSAELAKRVVLGHARAGRTTQVTALAPLALFIQPDDADLHAALGRALASQGKTTEAILALERALQFGPSEPRAIHRSLAGLYERTGQGSKAALHNQLGAGRTQDAGQ